MFLCMGLNILIKCLNTYIQHDPKHNYQVPEPSTD